MSRGVNLNNKVALVIGANGITGTHIIEHLLAQAEDSWAKIIGTSRKSSNQTWLNQDLGLKNDQITAMGEGKGRLGWISVDLVEESLDSIVQKFKEGGVEDVTHVFYCACMPSIRFDGLATVLTVLCAKTSRGVNLNDKVVICANGITGTHIIEQRPSWEWSIEEAYDHACSEFVKNRRATM
ncbi:hypothetical protein SeMB42_g06308 [Synchytrium endobioticum]|uniref:NAD-dependent epimerase/dehydratase domain-containing protein n=1 Tax=Synchytrium endobioticum TaxID=286115 RepID=A0A507CM57_9FUNG|nr:hypothetical protein SeMB42_g06308 [Synchytrium endobioticum]